MALSFQDKIQPASSGVSFASKATGVAPSAPAQSLSDQLFSGISSILPGKQIGEAVGNSLAGPVGAAESLARGEGFGRAFGTLKEGFAQGAKDNSQMVGKVAGDAANAVALPASLVSGGASSAIGGIGLKSTNAVSSFLKARPLADAALTYGTLGATQAGGQSLANGNDVGQAGKDALVGGAVGGATGGAFNLLGKAISKVASTGASVTSGVPKAAIEQAGVNPAVTKAGVKLDVPEVRTKMVSSLQSLYNDLNKEHSTVSSILGSEAPANADKISSTLVQKAQNIAQEFKVKVTPGAEGLATDFSKSAIVNGGEERVVNKAIQTISTWDDFSEKGLQTLNQRINALKNYDEGVVSKSSAIVGKIHDSISKVIEKESPTLHELNKNFSTNKAVLDNISDVIGADAKDPVAINTAVSRLDNIFKENRDEYVNIIRQLGDRSGVDYLSTLAGGEFQKILPNYLRSAFAVASAGGVGAVATNPMSLLLLPLFSPRAVGVAARNAPAIAKASSQLTRAASTQAIQKTVPKAAQQ